MYDVFNLVCFVLPEKWHTDEQTDALFDQCNKVFVTWLDSLSILKENYFPSLWLPVQLFRCFFVREKALPL